MPNHSEAMGLLLWLAMIVASLWWRRRFQKRKVLAPSTPPTEGTGPKWEQDEPYALMLDDLDEEDDLYD